MGLLAPQASPRNFLPKLTKPFQSSFPYYSTLNLPVFTKVQPILPLSESTASEFRRGPFSKLPTIIVAKTKTMEAQDILDKSASPGVNSTSLGLPSATMLSIRKARKAEEKMKSENIARSKSLMARQAIKASATATRIPVEIAARNSERSSERKRIQDAQKTSEATTEDEAAMIAYVLAATDDDERRERALAPQLPKPST